MAQYPAVILLSSLNGTTGFKLSGAKAGDSAGFSVSSAGDVNGDGFDDVIVGAVRRISGQDHGISYVVFGNSSGIPADQNLDLLNGTNGFRITGETSGDLAGLSVSTAGDVNGDGFDDLIIGAPNNTDGYEGQGASYVLFGRATFTQNFNLVNLQTNPNGGRGFKISGEYGAINQHSGYTVADAGDVNGDGFADVIIGTSNTNSKSESWVVFGKASGFPSDFHLENLDPSNGFKLNGPGDTVFALKTAGSAGDVNGDGFDDVIVGVPGNTGVTYVVFGKASFSSAAITLSSLNGTEGFQISGTATEKYSGFAVASAGDINGDGYADIIIGARNSGLTAGAGYVVFGKAGGFTNIDLSSLDGDNGFKLYKTGEAIGHSVSSVGDINGDGLDDIVISAIGAGAVYVVFGRTSGFDATFDLSTLDGTNGFKLFSGPPGALGYSVDGAGDINHDGLADLIVGAPGTNLPNNGASAGAVYVLYGIKPDAAVIRTGTDASQTLVGSDFNDTLSGLGGSDHLYGNGGADKLDGGTGADMMEGGLGNDTYYVDNVDDQIIETGGHDRVHTSIDWTLTGRLEDLYANAGATGLELRGNTLGNGIFGGDGDDRIDGKSGADHMEGGAGDDIYFVDDAGDTVSDTSGEDRVYVKTDWTLANDAGIERIDVKSETGSTVNGNNEANLIFGGEGNDHLNGGTGDDTIKGGDGNDVITGGAGRDLMFGNAGADTFVFLAASDSAVGANRDQIKDFSDAQDVIDVSAIDAIAGGSDDAFTLVSAFTGTAGELRVFVADGNTVIAGDINGDAHDDFAILLNGVHSLGTGNLML